MQCPICGAIAENISPYFGGLAVRCHNCGEFEVAELALNDLLRLDGTGRAAALEKAKQYSAAGAPPTIERTYLRSVGE
jgi:hypothetical protein